MRKIIFSTLLLTLVLAIAASLAAPAFAMTPMPVWSTFGPTSTVIADGMGNYAVLTPGSLSGVWYRVDPYTGNMPVLNGKLTISYIWEGGGKIPGKAISWHFVGNDGTVRDGGLTILRPTPATP